jgi:hypothetical protein
MQVFAEPYVCNWAVLLVIGGGPSPVQQPDRALAGARFWGLSSAHGNPRTAEVPRTRLGGVTMTTKATDPGEATEPRIRPLEPPYEPATEAMLTKWMPPGGGVVHGAADDPAWSEHDALLVRLADEIHDTCDVSDSLWVQLAKRYTDDQLLELVITAGWYRLLSTVVNAVRVQQESWAHRFPTART